MNDKTVPSTPSPSPLHLAVIGAGPVGLTLALLAAQTLPDARISLFDARPVDSDVSADPRTLALSLGSVQLLRRLGAWNASTAEPILEVHVSQQPPTLALPLLGTPEVRLSARDEAVPLLGAVLGYGALVAPLQQAWMAEQARQPGRLATRFGEPVTALKDVPGGVEIDAGIVERVDLAVVAEGGVFAEQARRTVARDYGQTAWVGRVDVRGAQRGLAVERFTRHGPAALLPLPGGQAEGTRPFALVWCVPGDDDPVRELDDAQRVAVLNTVFPRGIGRIEGVSPLKDFALGLNAERSLVQGRRVRVGNAAQTLHPVAGQGLNLGLRDAYSLVQALRRRPGDIDAALRRVEWQRAPDRWTMIAATDFLARSFTWHWPGLGAARGLGLALVDKLPPLKSALARQMMFGRR